MLKMLSKPLDASLFFVIFLIIFNYTLTNMAAPYVAGSLGASNDIATYTITFYALGNALGLPLAKDIASRLGTVKTLVGCLLLFAVFSFLCTTPKNFPLFIGYRFLQGLVSGPLFPIVQRILFTLNPKEKKNHLIALIVVISTLSPVVGACYGGWIAYDYHWKLFFAVNIPILLFLAALFWRRLRKEEVSFAKAPFDIVGYASYAIGVSGLCFAITTGQEFDWQRSPLVVSSFLGGALFFVFFLLWVLHHPHPIIDVKLFKIPSFAFSMINLAFLFSAYFGMVLLLGLWLSLYANYTPIWNALLIGHMGFAALFLIFFLGRYFQHFNPRLFLMIALFFLALSCFYTTLFAAEINFGRIAFSRVLAGLGLAFFLAPLFRLTFDKLDEKNALDGIVIFQIVRALSSGLGAAIYTTIWYRRRVFYHNRLGSQLTPFSAQTKEYYAKASEADLIGRPADAKLSSLLDTQATALALDDTFYCMGWVLVGLSVLLLLTYIFNNFFHKSPYQVLELPQDN